MSVMVAIKDKNRVVVGVDVRMSCGEAYVDSYPRRPKAIHVNNKRDIIVGAVGNIGLVDIIRQQIAEYQEKDLYLIDRPWIVKFLIPALSVSVRDYEMTDKEGKMDGMLILAIRDRAYLITGNYTVEEIMDYAADGSGRDAALGSLYTTSKTSMSPEDRIKIAIEAAGTCVNTVSKMSYIGDTAGKMFLTTSVEKKQK